MKHSITSPFRRSLLNGLFAFTFACALVPLPGNAASPDAIVDDFSQAELTSSGFPRIVINDVSVGGQSKATLDSKEGVLTVKGQLVPARGQPAFVSMVLLLSPQGEPQDVSQFEGIRLRVHVKKGGLSVLAASSEVQNFDFHAAVVARSSGGIKEVKIPFREMKRVWSEQTPLNLKTITSINLVASGLQKGAFLYEVDEVGFY